jgi:hypothetical protein
MTVKDLLELLLELDDQVICPRPSAWLKAAQLVRDLAEHAEPSLRCPEAFGDGWDLVDVSDTRKRNEVHGQTK